MRPYSGRSDKVRVMRPSRAVAPGPKLSLKEQVAKLIRGMPEPSAGQVPAEDGSVWIRVDQTRPMEGQPRRFIDSAEMAIFTAGIAREGQQDPVIVRRVTDHIKDKYELIGGERRWRAAVALGLSHLRAVIKNPADRFEQYKMAVIDNCGKTDLEPLDTAATIDELLRSPELKDLTESQQMDALMSIYCKSAGWVSYHQALLNLDPRVKAMMDPELPDDKKLKTLMGAFISTIHNGDEQVHVAEYTLKKGLSVAQAREYARRIAEKRGFSVGARALRPSDDYKRFRNFVKRLTIELDLFHYMPASRVAAMFRSKDEEDRVEMLRILQDKIERLIEFRQTLKGVNAKKS